MTEFEMRYMGWNQGVRVERHEAKSNISILELVIDGVDVLKLLESTKSDTDESKGERTP